MRFSQFEERLVRKIEDALPGASPGVQVQVHQAGRKVCDVQVGQTYAYYDLASLTKAIFTSTAMMKAFDEGKWNLQSRVSDFLRWFPHPEVLVTQLLTHSSGLVWWSDFYKRLPLDLSLPEKWRKLEEIIKGLPLQKNETSVYSDVGFLVLGYLLQEFEQAPLIEVWGRLKQSFYPHLATLQFHPDNRPPHEARFYAPTERCSWREKIVQGEVHDENAWSLGGVSSHAGLFGSIDEVSWAGLFLRSQLMGISRIQVKLKTAKLFMARALPLGQGDWALGFMMPTPGSSSAGKYFSPYSIGHTGFTGTSFWFDPQTDLLVVILSNRVFLGRDIQGFAKLRPQIHDWVVEGLKRS